MPTTNEPLIDELFEDKVASCLLHVTEFAVAAAQHLRPSYFSNPLRHNIAKVATDFIKAYGATPTAKALIDELVVSVKPTDLQAYGDEIARLRAVDRSDFKWVLEKLIVFIKNKETKRLIEDAVTKFLPKNDFASIEKGMAKIANITTTSNAQPVFHFSNDEIAKREARREKEYQERLAGRSIGISTGIPFMDRTLAKGGWYSRELYVLMAAAKRGKTMSLLWFANYAAWQGFYVPFFTMETSTLVLSDRMDAMNTTVETKMLVDQRNAVARRLKARRPKGEVIFYEYPTKQCTVGEIDQQLHRLEVERGIKPSMLVVDYGDIMKPTVIYKDKLAEQASIFEELRGLATKYDIPVLTATQINRAGTGKALNTGTDVSGTYEKIMVADSIITFSATDDELKQRKLRIHFAESRNNERAIALVETKYAAGTFYSSFLGEE